MKKPILLILSLGLILTLSFAEKKSKFIILITEQNIQGPQRVWWATEVDLSITEGTLAQRLINQGYEIIDPSSVNKIISQNKAFRIVDLSEPKAVRLGRLSKADFVILGKAIASGGGSVPQSNLRSCFANITVRLIRVKDGKVIAYLDASGKSAHLDLITAGKEALINAGQELGEKIIEVLSKEGGK
ncbi:MAG: CsgG/HfaB family protein [Candidatus Omnitrophica bacterium]|nr:CsgG/HfaB family protein [Candidatus Omnitrophota bacterium]